MTPQQLLDDIYLIKIPLPDNPLKDLNSYLIKGKERHLLVDTGFRSRECRDAMQDGLDALNVNIDDTDIFLTHSHYDHTGLASLLASDKTTIYVGEIDARSLKQYHASINRDMHPQVFLASGFPAELMKILRNGAPDAPLHPTEMECTGVVDGHVFRIGRYSLRCVHTPGHTPGHMCLYDEEAKLLICGDHILFDITPNITPWMGMDDALGAFMDSLKMISQLDILHTFCAHRGTSGDCKARIREMLAHHQERLQEVLRIVESGKGLSAYDVAQNMRWAIRATSWEEIPLTQKIFAVGEAAAHLEHLRVWGVLHRESQREVYIYTIKKTD